MSRTPSRIKFRNFNPSCGKLRESPDPSCANPKLHETDNVVDAIKNHSGEDVRDDDGLVITGLVCSN